MLFVRRDVFPSGVTPLPKDRVWTQILAETEGLDHQPRARFARAIALIKLREFQHAALELAAYREAFPEDRESGELGALLEASARGDPRATSVLEELSRGRRRE
jgi:hypothetical protein